MRLPNISHRFPTILPLVFVFAFLFSLWSAQVGWQHPIGEEHNFRQTQTAITAYYLKKGGNFFAYETPVLGAPWSIPFELPVYQWIVAKCSLVFGMPLESAGRLIAKFFYYLALFPLWGIIGFFGVKQKERFLLLTVYLLSPLILFWSRAFMIESTALFFALLYFYFALAAIEKLKQKSYMVLAGIAGILAATIKVTTFFAFAFALSIWLSWKIYLYWCERKKIHLSLFLYSITFFALLPFLALLFYTIFSDQQKAANPLADFILSKNLTRWNFGTWEQRLDPNFWYMIFRKHLHGAIGHRTTWILSVVLSPLLLQQKKYFYAYFFFSFLFLVPPLTFTNLYLVHDYYAYANVIFLILAFAFFCVGLLKAKGFRAWIGMIIFFVGISLSIRDYLGKPYHSQLVNDDSAKQFGKFIQDHTDPNDILLIFGFDWHPLIPYFSERRAIMNRDNWPIDSQPFRQAIDNIQGQTIGAVVFCGPYRATEKMRKDLEPLILIREQPDIPRSLCDIHLRLRK